MILVLTTSSFIGFGEVFENSVSHEANVENKILAVTGATLKIAPYRVSKSVSWVFNFLNPMDLEIRKINLTHALCQDVGADIIVDPQFSYSKRILGGGKLTLTGYPAKYEDFRSLSETEIDSLILKKNTPEDTIIFINR